MNPTPVLGALAAAVAVAAPDAARDTLSPVYDWATLPYRWEEISAGQLPVTPVHWNRSAKNPVVGDGMNSRPVRVDEHTLRIYFGSRTRPGLYSFEVDDRQPEKLQTPPVGPFLKPGPAGTYDDDLLLAPEPVRLSPTHLRMYYSAKKKGGFFAKTWTLAVADSHDNGVTWTKFAGNPILEPTDELWESGAVGFCSVEKTATAWKMWYLGTDQNADALKQVGYATSLDGLKWTRHAGNPIIPVNPRVKWEAKAIAVPRVIRDDRLYKVWYCSYPQNDTYAIGQAESFDGIRWFRSPHNPVMKGDGTGFDSAMTAYPGVIRVGDRYLMWYSGNSYGSAGIGFATAEAPRGTWSYRTGATEIPDNTWSEWRALTTPEPPRQGYIQFAVTSSETGGQTTGRTGP
ncbi:MAG: hypothetical protein PCFJNLEI_01243 [Verrucomicrobiae bacterium]|nr:hypothetical protein [Verrucomicrobiae bacterium]